MPTPWPIATASSATATRCCFLEIKSLDPMPQLKHAVVRRHEFGMRLEGRGCDRRALEAVGRFVEERADPAQPFDVPPGKSRQMGFVIGHGRLNASRWLRIRPPRARSTRD